MRDEFRQYLQDVAIEGIVYDRIAFIHSIFEMIVPETLEEIFVDNYVNQDGTPSYESLWFFSESFAMEAPNFLSEFNIDCVPYRCKIERWQIQSQNFDFHRATEAARLVIDVNFGADIGGNMKAAGRNCDYLLKILTNRISRNMVQHASRDD